MTRFDFFQKKQIESTEKYAKFAIQTVFDKKEKPEPPKTTPHRDGKNFLISSPYDVKSRFSTREADVPESAMTSNLGLRQMTTAEMKMIQLGKDRGTVKFNITRSPILKSRHHVIDETDESPASRHHG